MSVRLAVAGQLGFDESTDAKIADYERSDLPEATKAALRFADAWLSSPFDVPPALKTALRAHFSPEQIVEMALSVWKWSQNKMMTALGMAPAINPSKKTLIGYDEEGKFQLIDG
jgi:hypothetical protein